MRQNDKTHKKGYYSFEEIDQNIFRKIKSQLDAGNDVIIKSAPDGQYKLMKNKYELI